MRGITRRRFVGSSAAVLASIPWLSRRGQAAGGDPDVADVRGNDPAAMVAAALTALGGISKFVKKGDYVVIKPNAGFANPPEWATTTHPQTVAAVARACLDAKAKQVMVVEYPLGDGKRCLERCGVLDAVASIPGVKVRILSSQDEFKKTEVQGGIALKSVEVAKAVLSADVYISIPAAKAHGHAGVSFSLKNAMGVIWDRKAFHTQLELHQAIADLGLVVRPHLNILDATRALLTNGPQGPGETATLGRLIAGKSAVAVDAYGLTLARFNNKQMTLADARHIELASRAGLGEAKVSRLRIKKVDA
ncbi:MAG: DUF362 domain-containing protein [Pseudomonadota bacterium]